jgi:hypothetical protein
MANTLGKDMQYRRPPKVLKKSKRRGLSNKIRRCTKNVGVENNQLLEGQLILMNQKNVRVENNQPSEGLLIMRNQKKLPLSLIPQIVCSNRIEK